MAKKTAHKKHDKTQTSKNVGTKGSNSGKGYIGRQHSCKYSESDSDHAEILQINEAKASTLASFHTRMEHEKDLLQKELEKSMNKMTQHVDCLMKQSSLSGSYFLGVSEMTKEKPIFSEKVFEQKDSLLVESTRKGREAHTIYNIFVAILILIFFKMLVHDTLQKGHHFIDLTLLYDAHITVLDVIILWIPSYVFSFTVVILVNLILSLKLNYVIYLPIYSIVILCSMMYPIYASFALNDNPVGGLILTCEMARLIMKMHSYFREKLLHLTPNEYKEFVPEFAKRKGVTFDDLNMPDIQKGDLLEEIRRFNYFLWIPTLVYRDEYPMRARTNKTNLFANLLSFYLCFYYVFALFKELVIPTFDKYFEHEATLEDVITTSCIAGILFMVLAFFGILHSWMNLFAEITLFGDRQFYMDWWNVSNYGAYYRKWNIIVHEWLFYYVYNDSVRFSKGKFSSFGAKFCVFFTSAVIHEVIIVCCVKFFFPILLIMFGGIGVFFMALTKSNNRLLGIGFWLTMIIGNGLLIALYCLEYNTRKQPFYQDKMEKDGLISFFVPQSYDYLLKRYS